MKTFTNCAEKKAKQFLNLLQGYTKGIRMTAILILLLMGVNNAWGKTVNGPRIYFDNSSMNMTSTQVYFVVGHNSFSRTYGPMTEISDTKLLYRDISKETYYNWGDATYVGFIQVGSTWGDGSWGSSNLKNATNYTAENTSWGSFDWQNTYYCKATSKGGAVSIDYKSAGYSGIPKYNATQSAKVRNTTSESYSTVNGNWPATLKLKGTYLSGDGASGRSEISSTKSSDGNDKRVYGAVVTGKITHSYSNLSEDYQFDGWGTSTPAAGNTYEYHITAATTVYAFFTKKYAVNFGVHSSGGGSISAKAGSTTLQTGNKIVGGSQVVFTALPSNGYQVEGWYSDANCTSKIEAAGTNMTYTLTALESTAYVYVKFKGVQYTVTLSQENATTAGTASVQATYGSAMPSATMPTRNGYTFNGYYDATSGGTQYYKADGSSARTWNKTSNSTLYAQWTAKNITINWNANGGYVTPTSSTYTYDGDAITLPTPSYAGHRFLGWFTAADGGTQITDVGTTNKPYTTVTYYAHWEVSIVEHKVTFGVGTNYTKYGTLTAATSSGSLTSGSNVVEGTSVTFTATPKTGYVVEGWYTNAACTEGKHDAENTTHTTTITGATNVYVKFVEKTWSVSFAATTGGTVEPSATQTVGEANGITVIAEAKTGYTFNGWTSSNGGTFADDQAEETTFYPTAATTVTASFTENLYAITVKSSDNNHGTVSQSTDKAGIVTTIEITATPKHGYQFVNWTATGGATIANPNSPETTITASATGTVTANFELIPPTTVYFRPKTKWKDNNPVIICDGNPTAVTPYDCNGEYYTAEVPGGTTNLKFGGNDEQTLPLMVPADNKVLYDMTETKITALYLKPGDWDKDGAWFAVYLCNGTDASSWYKMTKIEGADLYGVEIESSKLNSTKNKNVIFVRMDKNKSELDWSSKWNQSKDLDMPTDGTNQCTISDYWNNSNASGSWHKVWDNSCWKEFTTPTYNITINVTGKGSIVVGGDTYTGDKEGKTTLTKTGVALNTSIDIGAKTPAERWSYKEGKITIGKNSEEPLGASHVICGPTTINVTFEQSNCKVTFELNGGTGNQPAPQEVTKGGKVTQPTPDPTRAGYTFDGWYKEPACTNAWNFSTDVVNQDITLYAKWEEIKYNLSTRNDYDHGTPDYDAPTKSGNQIGVSTTATVTASNTLKGYTFVGWDLANCERTDNGAETATSIIVRYNGNGGEALVVAKYEENLTSNYVVRGGAKFGNTWSSNANQMTKLSGRSYEDIVYFTIEIDDDNLDNSNDAFKFKIYDATKKNNDGWYGLDADGNQYYYTETTTGNQPLRLNGGKDIELRASMPGEYVIKVDYTDPSNLKLTVNFPSVDLYIVGVNGDWGVKDENKFAISNGIATISKEVTRAGNHTFKLTDGAGNWRTMNAADRTITRNNHIADFSDFSGGDGTNTTLNADVTGVYTFTYNIATNEFNVTYPALVTLSDGVSEAVSSSQTPATLTSVPGQMVTATPTMDIGANGNTLCWKLYDKDQDINNLDETVDVNFISLGNGKITFELPKVTGTYYLQLTIHAGADCSDETLIETIICPINVSTENTVFFQDESGKWKNVYVYFYGENGYWGTDGDWDKGSGAREVNSYKMTKINGTNIFYYKYSFDISSKNIAFTDHNQGNGQGNDGKGYQWFSSCQVVYRSDFASCAPMFVLDKNHGVNHNTTAYYYTDGYWTTYMGTSSGYWLHIDGNGVADPSHEMTTTTVGKRVYTHKLSLNGNNNHYDLWFGGCNGTNYGVESNMTVTNCTEWNLYAGSASVNLHATASGDYTFILYCNPDGHFQLSVEFPVAKGDFQLIYDDEQQNPHPSDYIRSSTVDGKLDTVSMYIRGEHGTGKTLKVQRCTGFNNGNPQWETLETYDDAKFSGLNLTKDTVYNFYMEQTVSDKTIAIKGTEFYSGKYYVRTKAADGGWDAYATEADNQMTYTEYSSHLPFDPYTHYFCKWVDDSNKDDVSYTVACDYAKALSDTLEGDNYTKTPESHALPEKANVRFTYDNRTNGLKRAYLTGASDSDFDDFLKLTKTKDGTTMKLGKNASDVSHVKLKDEENWVYATEIYVTSGGYSFDAMLTAVYPKSAVDNPAKKQYFFAKKNNDGTYAGETLIGGTDDSEQLVTIRYDFKTNRLMRAWKPSDEIEDEELPLSADILLIREGQNAAKQLVFSDPTANKITNVKTIFGALEFKYDNMVGKLGTGNWDKTSYHYCRYYVSFPFDVRISEIFGAGNYGEDYIIQKYNGTKRAEIGWFAETETFWETMDKSEKLNKYEGYCVMLNRTPFNDGNSHVWKNKKAGGSVYLYFPSASHKDDWTINAIGDVVIAIPEHKCNIDRDFTQDVKLPVPRNHKNTDSHWNMVGTPLFQNATAAKIADGPEVEEGDGYAEPGTRLQYVYDWVNTADIPNGTAARKAWGTDFEFKAMHSYLIQFAGEVSFQGSHIANHVPSAIAARRVAEDVKNYTVELQLDRDSAFASRTYVELQENAEDGFLLNEDMYMGSSSPIANLYTYAGAYDVAANVLSVNSHIVPVGIQVKKAGTYTFSMTTPFDGTVTLIDYHTGARTNLGWSNYTITLEKGTINDRFALEINIQHVSTDVEGNTGNFKGKDGVKFLHNGILYIKKGDTIYDARGSKVSMSYEL